MAQRQKLAEHRTKLAGGTAGAMIDALVEVARTGSDDDIEDDLCGRYGSAMIRLEGGPVEDMVNPEDLARALLAAVDDRLHDPERADGAALQRVLAVVAGLLPPPLHESAHSLVTEHLDVTSTRQVERGRALTGPVLWAHDAYGCRWAVVAPFAAANGADRWYLWDVDTCGYDVVTVHSAFHDSAESAVQAWRESVGPEAAGTAALTPVDARETLDALLRGEVEVIRIGGKMWNSTPSSCAAVDSAGSHRLRRTPNAGGPAHG